MKDITKREDIAFLVDEFYQKAKKDDLIGFFFTEVVALDWSSHIPKICDFWESILLGNMVFSGNPMVAHLSLNKKARMKPEHFERWLLHWDETVKAYFEGEKAFLAMKRAHMIADLMKFKIEQNESSPTT